MIILKSQQEIELMRKSGELTFLVLEKLKQACSPGVTTRDLDNIAYDFIVTSGALPSFKGYKGGPGVKPYPASICASINEEVVHGIPDDRVLKSGDIVSIDVGVYLNGYHGDAARTFPIGEVSQQAQKLIDVTRESFFRGIQKARKGYRILDISGSIQDFVEDNGFTVVKDFVGHGIGRKMHEAPQIPNYRTPERGPRLQEGMTLAIEPMVNAGDYAVRILNNKWTVVTSDNSLSAHYENTIAVTKDKPLVLTLEE